MTHLQLCPVADYLVRASGAFYECSLRSQIFNCFIKRGRVCNRLVSGAVRAALNVCRRAAVKTVQRTLTTRLKHELCTLRAAVYRFMPLFYPHKNKHRQHFADKKLYYSGLKYFMPK